MNSPSRPLADRMRPQNLSEFAGQEHLVGDGKVLARIIETGYCPSIIFWGPPGIGKTTLARMLAKHLGKLFIELSAINAGVKDVRAAIATAKNADGTILFIDEIHRFSKSQQDSLLGAVENGTVTLIGATTENPSFEVISALLSRCQVYVLQELEKEDLLAVVQNALAKDSLLQDKNVLLQETDALLMLSGGDVRKLLNLLELVVLSTDAEQVVLSNKSVSQVAQNKMARYDKTGEQHYDIISAFIKSIRGSDPQAAVYWLARMLHAGEDPKFIARRILISAAEDVGLANPTALVMANTCFEAVSKIGMPEARIILSQTVIYLANSPKSNSGYLAIDKALAFVKKTGDLGVPLHLRNAPTKLMKELDYGKNYKYSHDFDHSFVQQDYLPNQIKSTSFYSPGKNSREEKMKQYLEALWGNKYDLG